jgi:hypothetical protein
VTITSSETLQSVLASFPRRNQTSALLESPSISCPGRRRQATGLGSVDAGLLIAHWSDFAGSSAGLSPTSGSAPLTYSATVNTAATARIATVTIDGQVLTVTRAAGGGAAQLSLSSPTMNFGSDEVGVSTAGQTVLVSNTGGTNLNLGQISITGTAVGVCDDGSTHSAIGTARQRGHLSG